MALDATVGGANSNSYLDAAEADALLSQSRLHFAAWTAATAAQKDAALIYATSLLDAYMDWYGSQASSGQALRWPRTGIVTKEGYSVSDSTIPDAIKLAVVDTAVQLLRDDPTAVNELYAQGISEAKVGSLAVKLHGTGAHSLLPSSVVSSLRNCLLGEPMPGASGTSGFSIVPIRRA